MKSLRYLLFLLSCILTASPGEAQEYGTLADMTPLSPSVAQLFKTWDKPVGAYTGTVPVSIPIYTPSALGVSLPISVDYNGGNGLKVEEIAASVGLGWNLSVGGMITRIRNGRMTDETSYYGYLDCSTKPNSFNANYTNLSNYANGLYDLEPDLFIYSFNGMSGRFAFDIHRNLVLLDRPADIKIKPNWITHWGDSLFGGFTITDPKGYNYYFAGYDSYTTSYHYGWRLSAIFDPNGKQLATLNYQVAQTYYATRTQAYITKYFGCCNQLECGPGDYGGGDMGVKEGVFEAHINKIVMGGDTITFTYSTRLDLDGGIKLNKIEVKNRLGSLVKRFNFNYSYFTPSGAAAPNVFDDEYKRLKLLNISEHPASGTDSLTHSFTYNENVMLPARMSNAIDYWGYYNNAGGWSSTIPDGLYHYGGTVAVSGYSDRRTYHDYDGANILTRITFPSGGYREFTYEGNQVLYSDNYKYDNLWCDYEDHTFQFFDPFETDVFDNSMPMTAPAYTKDFTINSDYGASLFYYSFGGWAYDFFVRIVDKNGMYETTLVEINNGLTYGYYAVPNGDYRIELYYDTYGDFYDADAWWGELNMSGSTISREDGTYRKTHRDVGGQRIKKIDDYDPITDKHKYTSFKYNLLSDTTLSSGMLISLPIVLTTGGCPYRGCDLMRISSFSAYPLINDNSSYVCYTNVRTIEEGNGYIDQEFSYASDASSPFFEFPAGSVNSNRAYRGKLLTQSIYNESKKLISKDSIVYHYPQSLWTEVYGLRIAIHKLEPYDLVYCSSDASLGPSREMVPETQWSTVYSHGGGSHQTKTEYTYLPFSYDPGLQRTGVQKVKVTRSDGNTTETWFRYPYNNIGDFTLPLSISDKAIKDTLIYYNILDPIETVTYVKKGVDSIFVSGAKMTNGFFSGAIHMKNVKKFTSLSDSITANFSSYDTSGNLQEQYLTDNTKEVYLWGYNGMYVVAKVVGSDYTTVAALVNNSVLQNPSSESALRTELNKIRTGLSDSKTQVTTFTYKPSVGVSSVTNPAGNTVYYEYDLHGRLLRVRDDNKNILKKGNYKVTQ